MGHPQTMRLTALALAGCLAVSCGEGALDVPRHEPPPQIPAALPAAPPAPMRDPTLALSRERARLEELVERTLRVNRLIEQVGPRVDRLRRIKNANTSRLTGVSAIVRALAGAPDGLDLRRIDATGVRWTLLVRTKLLEDAEILGRSLSQALSSPYSEPIPYPADGTTSYLIRTHYPSEGLGVTPGAPETARAPQGKRDHGTPVREKSLRLDVERLRGQGNTRELVSARDKLSKLRDELVVLEREMLPERGRELRVEAVIDAAEGAGMDAVRFDDDGPVRFHGTTAHRWRVRGVGSLDQVATAVGKVAASGALLGDLTINRVKRADRFRVRMAVYAPRR